MAAFPMQEDYELLIRAHVNITGISAMHATEFPANPHEPAFVKQYQHSLGPSFHRNLLRRFDLIAPRLQCREIAIRLDQLVHRQGREDDAVIAQGGFGRFQPLGAHA